VGISGFLLANLWIVLSYFWRGFPLPKYLVAAVMAETGTRAGNSLLRKLTRPTEAVLVRDLLLPLGGGEIADFFIDLFS